MELNSSGQGTLLSLLVDSSSDESANAPLFQDSIDGEFPKLLEIAAQETSLRTSLKTAVDAASTGDHSLVEMAGIAKNARMGIQLPADALARSGNLSHSPNSHSPNLHSGSLPAAAVPASAVPTAHNRASLKSISLDSLPSTASAESTLAQLSTQTLSVSDTSAQNSAVSDGILTDKSAKVSFNEHSPTAVSTISHSSQIQERVSQSSRSPVNAISGLLTANDHRVGTGMVDVGPLGQSDVLKPNSTRSETLTMVEKQHHSAQPTLPPSLPSGSRDPARTQPAVLNGSVNVSIKEGDLMRDGQSTLPLAGLIGRAKKLTEPQQTSSLTTTAQLSASATTGVAHTTTLAMQQIGEFPSKNQMRAPSSVNTVIALSTEKDAFLPDQRQELKPSLQANAQNLSMQRTTLATEDQMASESLVFSPAQPNGILSGKAVNETRHDSRSFLLETQLKDSISIKGESLQSSVRADTVSLMNLSSSQPTDEFRIDKPLSPVTSLPLNNVGSELPAKLGQQVRFMAENGVQTVVMRVNPAELGPVRIEVAMDNEQLSVNISATHSLAREMLESALPRLRDALVMQNDERVEVNVSQQDQEGGQLPADQQAQQQQRYQLPVRENVIESDGETLYPKAVAETTSNGHIDAYV